MKWVMVAIATSTISLSATACDFECERQRELDEALVFQIQNADGDTITADAFGASATVTNGGTTLTAVSDGAVAARTRCGPFGLICAKDVRTFDRNGNLQVDATVGPFGGVRFR